MHILSRFDQILKMVKDAIFIRPARLQGLYPVPSFIPFNSKDHLLEVDMGFKENPLYRQEKLVYFTQENIYYQKLAITDGRANFIKDDARTIIISGKPDESTSIQFRIDIYPSLPSAVNINRSGISLPFYPEVNTEIVIRDSVATDMFYQFSCYKIIYTTQLPYLQLRCLAHYSYQNLANIFRKWHSTDIQSIENIPRY